MLIIIQKELRKYKLVNEKYPEQLLAICFALVTITNINMIVSTLAIMEKTLIMDALSCSVALGSIIAVPDLIFANEKNLEIKSKLNSHYEQVDSRNQDQEIKTNTKLEYDMKVTIRDGMNGDDGLEERLTSSSSETFVRALGYILLYTPNIGVAFVLSRMPILHSVTWGRF